MIRPLFSTIVDPSEYAIDAQMEAWVKDANKNKACFHGIDVGKMWGLYLSWKQQRDRLAKAERIIAMINKEPRLYDTIKALASDYAEQGK